MSREAIAALGFAAGMSKQALGLGWLGKLVPKNGLGRAATGLGVGFGAANVGQHLFGGGPPTLQGSPESKFQQHNQAYTTATADLRGRIANEIGSGNWDEVDKLQGQLAKGDMGVPSRSFGRSIRDIVWPWAKGNEQPASYHQQQALKYQGEMQGEYDKAVRKHLGDPQQDALRLENVKRMMSSGNVMPQQQDLLRSQLVALRQRLAKPPGGVSQEALDIWRRMNQSGMAFRQPAEQPVPGPSAGAGGGLPAGWVQPGTTWQPGPRPGGGNTAYNLGSMEDRSGLNSGRAPLPQFTLNDWQSPGQ